MCGIAGIFDGAARAPIDEAILRKMTRAIAHRGPDGEGIYASDGIGLGHRRLAIIDLAGGAQPMWSSDGSHCVVFNGEIYNYRELAAELTALGYAFTSRSDTEVILNGWRAWGIDCLQRLEGQFAFAIWNKDTQTLTLARDRVGKKPLYYAYTGESKLVFASELKALQVSGLISRKVDPAALEDYLTLGYVPDPKTIYRSVYKLPPGSYLQWQRGRPPEQRTYWDFRPERHRGAISLATAAAELSERLRHAVAQRMIADVPLGAFLSGGVDSSGIVAHMAMASGAPVKTCTIGFGSTAFDERASAKLVADRYHTDHVEMVVSADHLAATADHLDRIVDIYDEPFADSSAVPTYEVCGLARERVTVALSGDGGDEAFAGYRRYLWHTNEAAVRRLLPQALRGPVFGTLARYYPRLNRAPRWLRARSTFFELSLDAADAYINNIATIPDPIRLGLYSNKFRSELQGYHPRTIFQDLMRRAPADEPLIQAQYADLKTWLPGRMLVKVDRASMAHGLEVRNPLLDYNLVQWGLSLPDELKCHGGNYKIVLKKALEPYLPPELLNRPKRGFSIPLSDWLRGPLRNAARASLGSAALLDTGWFDAGALTRLVDDHMTGERDHSAPIWSLMVLERFLARAVLHSDA